MNADPSANTEGTTIFAKNLTVPIVSPETPPELKNEERGKYFYLVNRWSDLVAYFLGCSYSFKFSLSIHFVPLPTPLSFLLCIAVIGYLYHVMRDDRDSGRGAQVVSDRGRKALARDRRVLELAEESLHSTPRPLCRSGQGQKSY